MNQVTLKEGVSLFLGSVFGCFSLVTMTAHTYSSSSLDRICVPVLSLGTPPKRLCLCNSPKFYTETAKFWDRNMHSIFICGLNTCALEMLELTSLLVTGCTLRLLFLLFPSVHKCQQENEQAKTEPLYALHLITLDSPFTLSLLTPLPSEAAVCYIPYWCN